jgi:hypothetical protein
MKAHTKKLAITIVLKNSDKDSRDGLSTQKVTVRGQGVKKIILINGLSPA